jgi:hypothetical protein
MPKNLYIDFEERKDNGSNSKKKKKKGAITGYRNDSRQRSIDCERST